MNKKVSALGVNGLIKLVNDFNQLSNENKKLKKENEKFFKRLSQVNNKLSEIKQKRDELIESKLIELKTLLGSRQIQEYMPVYGRQRYKREAKALELKKKREKEEKDRIEDYKRAEKKFNESFFCSMFSLFLIIGSLMIPVYTFLNL